MPAKPKMPILKVLLSALIMALASPALAQEVAPQANPPNDILPVKAASEADFPIDESNPTHPAIKLTPDKSELIRLDRKAAVVLVGNPAHLSILPEGSNTLVLVPQAPGATYFTVLDEDNQVIMQRHVLVATPKEKYVRIRKPCLSGSKCEATKVYYCPDMCHEIILNDGSSSTDGASSGKTEQKETAEQAESAPVPNHAEEPNEPSSDGEEAVTE